MDLAQFRQLPILGILRGIDAESVQPLTECIVSSGLKSVELAMNTPNAENLIRDMVKISGGRLMIGAGTVLTMNDLNSALDAEASFIILPASVPSVIEHCLKNAIPVFPGALSPQEIYNAWNMGATMVKVFPAKFLGPQYLKEIKGPFPEIELLACGGITPENIADFFSCGASAVAFGASIFKKQWLAEGKFARIEQAIKTMIRAYESRVK